MINRTTERAHELVEDLRAAGIADATWGTLGEPVPGVWGVIVNATSLGHHGAAPNVDPGCYSPQSVAIELAYNPPETGFMRTATAAGARAENGLGMLLHQAALAFECWTGQAPPMAVFEAAAKGDELANETLDRFCGILGSVAGDLALTFGARGGVFVSGGIAPRMADRLVSGAFRARFEDKGRLRPYVEQIPTSLVLHPYPAILGAARELEMMERL